MTTTQRSRPARVVPRRIATLMGLEAASLAVMSCLHLSGILAGGSRPFDRADAGIAEALICLALTAGALSLTRALPRARGVALATIGFAILGFLVGLSLTVQGGDAIDVAYHATVLPLLCLTLALLLRTR
jgi:hypothetical protein